MIVLCIEGCHGSGKTELCTAMESKGYQVLDEAFLDMPKSKLHPQTLIMETMWVANWFKRLLEHECAHPNGCRRQSNKKTKHAAEKTEHEAEKTSRQEAVIIADRSPFSAVFYSQQNGLLLDPVIKAMVHEAADNGIEIYTVLMSVDNDVLWTRICDRLEREPRRMKFNEHDRKWMEAAQDFYENHTWDHTVSNNSNNIQDAVTLTESYIDAIIASESEKHTTEE